MAIQMPKSQRDQGMLLVAFLSLAAIGAYYNYVFAKQQTAITTVQAHVDSLKVANQRAKAELAKGSVNELRAQAERYQQNLSVMRQLVPTGTEVPALIEQVSTAARRVGLEIGDLEPEPVVAGDQFDTYKYKIGLVGGYDDIAAFLTNVGSLTRIVAPINLQLTPSQNAAAQSHAKKGDAVLQATFEIKTYVARSAPAPQPGAKS